MAHIDAFNKRAAARNLSIRSALCPEILLDFLHILMDSLLLPMEHPVVNHKILHPVITEKQHAQQYGGPDGQLPADRQP
ncbi:hypothetical protein D3C73_1121260 [compost metagenome]